MSLLDSPLDALVFDYVNYGVFAAVNNLWTWVAVVTAAVSFWRIRVVSAAAAACLKSSVVDAHSIDRNENECHQLLTEESSSSPPSPSPPQAPAVQEADPVPETSSTGDDNVFDGTTKGKFSLYYESDDVVFGGSEETSGECEQEEEKKDGECGGAGEWWRSWERVLRMEENGWYRHQDLTVINGNVVRLWDDCRLTRRITA